MQNTRLFNRIINYLKGKDMLLPSVTSSDEGKVLTVEGKNVQGSVLVPEETFVFTDSVMAEIDMKNKSLFVENAKCLLTVDGTTITATVQTTSEPDNGLYVEDTENGVVIFLEDVTNVAKIIVPNEGTYTVSLYIEDTEYVWTPAESGGGYDLIIEYNSSTTLCTLISGHVSDVYNKLQDSEPVEVKIIRTSYDATFPAVAIFNSVYVQCLSAEGTFFLRFLDYTQATYTNLVIICEDDSNIYVDE